MARGMAWRMVKHVRASHGALQRATLTSSQLVGQVMRDAWCLEIMHRAFVDGLMEYGMVTAQKPKEA